MSTTHLASRFPFPFLRVSGACSVACQCRAPCALAGSEDHLQEISDLRSLDNLATGFGSGFSNIFYLFKFRCASHSHELGLGYLNPCKARELIRCYDRLACMYVTLVGMLTMWMKPVRLKGCDKSRYAEHICCAFAWLRCNTNVCKSSYA